MQNPLPPDEERDVERDQEYQDTVAAVLEGLADVEAGRVQPLAEVAEEFRRKFEFEDTAAAIQQGMAEAEAGLGTPLEGLLDEARRELNSEELE